MQIGRWEPSEVMIMRHCTVVCTSLRGGTQSVPLSAGRALWIACLVEYQTRVQGNPPLATVTQLHLGADKHQPVPRYVWYMQYRTQWARWHTCNRLALFSLLGAFVKLRKASISFVMFIFCPPAWKQFGSHWTDFHEVSYFIIWRKSVEGVQFSLNTDKNNGYFTRRSAYIYDNTVIPRLTKIIRSGITFVSRNLR